MNDQAATGPLMRQLLRLELEHEPDDGAQALQTGLQLGRASQVTMLRLQLALHGADRRGAMRALDSLLDIDAELEQLAAALGRDLPRAAPEQTLADYIAREKAAIATEKHILTGDTGRTDPAAADITRPGDLHFAAAPEMATPIAYEEADWHRADPRGSPSWPLVLAVVAMLIVVGLGLATYLQPDLASSLVGRAHAEVTLLAARAG